MTDMIQKGHHYEYKYLEPSKLKIDPLYQRGLDLKRVKNIVDHW